MKRSKFSLSSYKVMSFDMGNLYPCGLVEVLPGDTIQQATSMLLRASPLLSPVMHPVHVRIHHWFVPHRLVWDDFEDFITGGPDGLDASVFPTVALTAAGRGQQAKGTLADYLGLPVSVDQTVSALPFRGYALIWNEFYRDQDLETELTIDTTDGADTTTPLALQAVDWEKDYFTSARPWEQKGPEVTIPLVGEAPVLGIGKDSSSLSTWNAVDVTVGESGGTDTVYADHQPTYDGAGAESKFYIQKDPSSNYPNIRADLSQASSVTVNALREALALQRFQEMRARYGSRYVEYLRSLGVRSSDGRLDRPEYLGGGKQTIQFSEVLATAESAAN